MSEELEPQETPQPASQPQFASPPPPPTGGQFYGMQQSLPNATAVLVLGILSILTCCCYGIVGLILAIIALVLSKKDRILYAANAALYTEGSYKNLNAGRVCAIVGLIFSILYLLFAIIFIAVFGFGAMNDPNAMKEIFEGMR